MKGLLELKVYVDSPTDEFGDYDLRQMSCFFCLQNYLSREEGNQFSANSLTNLSHFINVNFRKVSQLTSTVCKKTITLDPRHVNVPLCQLCGDVMKNFCRVYGEPDATESKLDNCLQEIQKRMVKASRVVSEELQVGGAAVQILLFQLRREVLEKCESKIKLYAASLCSRWRYECTACRLGFNRFVNLRYHQKLHSNTLRPVERRDPKETMKKVKGIMNRVIHKQIEKSEDYRSECRYCPQKFWSVRDAEEHVIAHLEDFARQVLELPD